MLVRKKDEELHLLLSYTCPFVPRGICAACDDKEGGKRRQEGNIADIGVGGGGGNGRKLKGK